MNQLPNSIQLVQSWPIKALVISFLLGVVCVVWLFPPEPVIITLGCEHINELVVSDDPWYSSMVFWN